MFDITEILPICPTLLFLQALLLLIPLKKLALTSFYKSYFPHNEYMEVFGVEVVSHALILPQGSLIGQ